MSPNLKKMEAQDALEEISLGIDENQKPTYVSKLLESGLWGKIVSFLQEFKDFFFGIMKKCLDLAKIWWSTNYQFKRGENLLRKHQGDLILMSWKLSKQKSSDF